MALKDEKAFVDMIAQIVESSHGRSIKGANRAIYGRYSPDYSRITISDGKWNESKPDTRRSSLNSYYLTKTAVCELLDCVITCKRQEIKTFAKTKMAEIEEIKECIRLVKFTRFLEEGEKNQ